MKRDGTNKVDFKDNEERREKEIQIIHNLSWEQIVCM